jgi:hypothetical protein
LLELKTLEMEKIKENFYAHLNFVITSTLDYIEGAIKKGKYVKIWEHNEDPEGDEDEFYDLPTITYVDKYNNYEQYAVMGVSNVLGEIILRVKGRGEDDSIKEFKLSEISHDDAVSLALLADIIVKRLN